MHNFLNDMKALNLQNRTVAIVENGSWTPRSGDLMEQFLDEEMKFMDVLNERVTVSSSVNDSREKELDSLAETIVSSLNE